MGAGHAHDPQYVHAHTVVHRLPAHAKFIATLLFVLVVVSTPYRAMWAFGVYALVLIALATVAQVPLRTLATRLVVEVPFVVFALLLPFISRGERIDVLDISVSVSGLWGAWNILAKATLGVTTTLLLAATTPLRDLVTGLDRLRMPTLIVQIMMFMIRYADVVTDEMRRMSVARVSRGFAARDLRALPVLARSIAALFIRSYERGERVHLAMVSRGYTGRIPLATSAATAKEWSTALALPALATCIALTAWTLR